MASIRYGNGGVTTVTVREAADLVRDGGEGTGALVIDVREPNEYVQARVEGAILMPLGQIPNHHAELPRDRKLMLMCRTGVRSENATKWLLARGYDNVLNVGGGIVAWHRAGLPIKSGMPDPGEGQL